MVSPEKLLQNINRLITSGLKMGHSTGLNDLLCTAVKLLPYHTYITIHTLPYGMVLIILKVTCRNSIYKEHIIVKCRSLII